MTPWIEERNDDAQSFFPWAPSDSSRAIISLLWISVSCSPGKTRRDGWFHVGLTRSSLLSIFSLNCLFICCSCPLLSSLDSIQQTPTRRANTSGLPTDPSKCLSNATIPNLSLPPPPTPAAVSRWTFLLWTCIICTLLYFSEYDICFCSQWHFESCNMSTVSFVLQFSTVSVSCVFPFFFSNYAYRISRWQLG